MEKEIIKAIDTEIIWTNKNKKQNPNSEEWFKGYVDGLTQARNIAKAVKKLKL